MFKLSNKISLVTGASGCIGKAISHTLAQAGATVILSGTNTQNLELIQREIAQMDLFPPIVMPCDLSKSDEVEHLLLEIAKHVGDVDILVNNAGITRDSLLIRMKDTHWSEVMELNLTSAFRLCRGVIKTMMRKQFGRIINMTSVVATMGNPGQANYCSAKAGLIGMSKSIAQEVGNRGITVNCVAPGFIDSAMTKKISDEHQKRILQNVPVGRMGRASDVAAGVLFLASDEASYITGQTLHINGGLEMI
jgi:3-oxoacyl-[acyl-carrier protein] reductase